MRWLGESIRLREAVSLRPCPHGRTCPMKTVCRPFPSDMSGRGLPGDFCSMAIHTIEQKTARKQYAGRVDASMTRCRRDNDAPAWAACLENASTHASKSFDACEGWRAAGHVR